MPYADFDFAGFCFVVAGFGFVIAGNTRNLRRFLFVIPERPYRKSTFIAKRAIVPSPLEGEG
ncbi:MAG: hypothetical protein LBV16_04690 [Elusimicrobiota bacterium]|nr:hypothetical protein [Elusimicrobiota bacterium]